MFERKLLASLILTSGLLAGPALAQQTVQPGHHPGGPMMGAGGTMMAPGGAMMGGHGISGGMWRMMGEDGIGGMGMMATMAGHVEGRLAFLKTELKITDAQLPLWDRFAAAVRDNSKAIKEAVQNRMTAVDQALNLPDRLAMREKLLSAQLTAVQKLKAAADPLYAALSADQKKTADELSGPMAMLM